MQVRGVNTNVFWKNNDENIPSLTYLESIKNEMVEWTNTKVNFVNFTTIEIVSSNTKYDYIMFHDETENIDKYFYYVATDVIANNKCVYTYFLDAVVTYLLPFMQTNNSKQFLTERSYILDKKTIQDTDTFVLNSPKNGTYEYDRAEYNFSNTPNGDTYVREYFEKQSNNSHESLRYTSPTNFTSEINGVLYMGFNALLTNKGGLNQNQVKTFSSAGFGNIYLIPLLGYDNGVNWVLDANNGSRQWWHPVYKDGGFKLEIGRRDKAPSDVTPLQTTTFRKVVTYMRIKNGSNTHVLSDFTNSSLSDFLNSRLNNISQTYDLSFTFNENASTSIEIEFGFIKVSGDKNIPNRVLTWDEMQQLNQHGTLTTRFNNTTFNVTDGKITILLQKANSILNGNFSKMSSFSPYDEAYWVDTNLNSPGTSVEIPPSQNYWLSFTAKNKTAANWNGTYYLLHSGINEGQAYNTLTTTGQTSNPWNFRYRENGVSRISTNSVVMHNTINGSVNIMGHNETISGINSTYYQQSSSGYSFQLPQYNLMLIKENSNRVRISFNGSGVLLANMNPYVAYESHSVSVGSHVTHHDGYIFYFNKNNSINAINSYWMTSYFSSFSNEYVTWTPQNQTDFPFTYTQIYNTVSFLQDIKKTNEAHFLGFFMLPHVFTFPSKSLHIMNLGVNYRETIIDNPVGDITDLIYIYKYDRDYLVLNIEPAGIDLTPFKLGSQNIPVQPQMLTYNNENMWWYLYKFCETKFMNFNIDLSIYYYTNNDFVSNGWFIFAGQGIYVDKVDIYNLISSTWLLPGPLPSMTDEYRAYVNSNINSANAAYKNSVNHLVSGVFNAGATVGLGVLTGGMSFAYSNKLINAAIGMNQNIINTNNTNGWINETFGKSLLAPGQKPLHYLKSMYNLKNVESYLKSAELSKTIGKQQVINGVEHATGGLFNSIVNLVNTRNNIKAQFQDARNRLGVSLSQSSADDAILESQWLSYQRHYNVVEKFIPDTDTIKNWNNIIYLYGFPGNRMMTFNQILNKPSDCIMHDCWYIGFNEIDLVQKLPLMETYNKLPNEIKDFIIEFLKKGVRFWDVNPTTIL